MYQVEEYWKSMYNALSGEYNKLLIEYQTLRECNELLLDLNKKMNKKAIIRGYIVEPSSPIPCEYKFGEDDKLVI